MVGKIVVYSRLLEVTFRKKESQKEAETQFLTYLLRTFYVKVGKSQRTFSDIPHLEKNEPNRSTSINHNSRINS